MNEDSSFDDQIHSEAGAVTIKLPNHFRLFVKMNDHKFNVCLFDKNNQKMTDFNSFSDSELFAIAQPTNDYFKKILGFTGPGTLETLLTTLEKGVDFVLQHPECFETPFDPKDFENNEAIVWDVGTRILNKTKFITFRDNEICYYYENGVYLPHGKVKIKERAQQILGERATINMLNEIVNNVKLRSLIDRDLIDIDKKLLCVENGILNIDTGVLVPHNPDCVFLFKLPVEFNPNIDCPTINKFFSDVLHDEDISVVEELIGYCLYRDYIFSKAFMLIGDGQNGKTTFLNMLITFLGEDNVVDFSLQSLSKRRFALAQLYSKFANIHDDLSDKSIEETGMFKQLTGGSRITADVKFKDPFSFRSYAKMIFSCNKPPDIKSDDSHAFWRRWIIINFPNTFTGKLEDPFMLEKITTKDELTGLLNLALKGLKRLLKQNGFSYNLSTAQVREDYIRKSDSVKAFIMDCLEIGGDKPIPKKGLYKVYADYCKTYKLPALTYQTFCGKLITEFGSKIGESHPRLDGKQVACWTNIKLLSNEKTKEKVNSKKKELLDFVEND